MLQRIKDEDVQIATADKDVVFREDKTTLYHYKTTASARSACRCWSPTARSAATR